MNVSLSLDLWQLVLAAVLTVVWLVRLEAKVMAAEVDRNRLEKTIEKVENYATQREIAIWEKLEDLQETMTEILQKLSRIEGNLEHKHD